VLGGGSEGWIALSETVGNVDRRVVRRELRAEALFMAGFTGAEIAGLGDLSEVSTDRLHELLWPKLGEALARATDSHGPVVEPFRRKKRSRKARKPKRSGN
jgi:hypothetical protein